MSKPYGLTATFQVIRPTMAEDKIYEAVQAAQCERMSVEQFIREAREAWDYEMKQAAKYDQEQFNRALSKAPR